MEHSRNHVFGQRQNNFLLTFTVCNKSQKVTPHTLKNDITTTQIYRSQLQIHYPILKNFIFPMSSINSDIYFISKRWLYVGVNQNIKSRHLICVLGPALNIFWWRWWNLEAFASNSQNLFYHVLLLTSTVKENSAAFPIKEPTFKAIRINTYFIEFMEEKLKNNCAFFTTI